MYFLLALVSGGLTALSRTVNAALGARVGSLRSSLINHVVGALAAGALVGIGLGAGRLYASGIPWIYFIGGCLGVFVVAASNYAAARIGVTLLAIVTLAFQLASSAFIDHYGLLGTPPRPLTLQRSAGIALLLAGAYVAFSAPSRDAGTGAKTNGGSHDANLARSTKTRWKP